MKTVAVFGGGIAGLTAAHELACRGFSVTVHEAGAGPEALGGKARTQYFRDPRTGATLPGEHGFRFFPSFYEAVIETMRRIPTHNGSVADRLVPTANWGLARVDRRLAAVPRRPPTGLRELGTFAEGLLLGFGDIPPRDLVHLTRRLIHYYMRGDIEREELFERMSFWDFLEGDRLDPQTQQIIQQTPKTLVAMDAREGNARTLLNLLFLMGIDFTRRGASDRVLDRPTSEAWIAPWREHLEGVGVQFRYGEEGRLRRVACKHGRVVAAETADGAEVAADEIVLALPAEVLQRVVLASGLERLDPRLARVAQLELSSTQRWMVGAQLYLAREQTMLDGHLGLCDSAWGLTAVSQGQYWNRARMARLATEADVHGVISIVATEWHHCPGASGRVASRCTETEVLDEIVGQVVACRGRDGRPLISPEEVVARHLDDDVQRVEGRIASTRTPLLIHPPGLWHFRPTPGTTIRGLTLCSDFVRNELDLATMEGANLAARHAVNDILRRVGVPRGAWCRVHDPLAIHEPRWLRAIKRVNDERFLARRRAGRVERPPIAASMFRGPDAAHFATANPPLAATA